MTLLEALQYLHDNPPDSSECERVIEDRTVFLDEGCGICFNLSAIMNVFDLHYQGSDGYDLVLNNCENWLHFSGDASYPIPRPRAEHWQGVWLGEQLVYRKSLLKHLMEKIA